MTTSLLAICVGLCSSATFDPVGTAPQSPPLVASASLSPREKAALASQRAIAFLRAAQDPKLGAWGVRDGVAAFPAYTGLALTGLLLQPDLKPDDPAIARAITYILSAQKPDGGIYTQALPSYNTAICLAALARIPNPDQKTRDAIRAAQNFLKSIQYSEFVTPNPSLGEAPSPVQKDHAFYGGWGYGRHGRPDLSNTQWALEALHESGLPPDDPAFQRAMVFLQRCQMVDSVNEMHYADGSSQGGFIYATSENKDTIGSGQSFAGTIEETLSDGTKASRLRCYGSMTYAGFKSYLYAGLTKNDPRVKAALGWIGENYTLRENPGLGTDGLYYYYVTFARALAASEMTSLPITRLDGSAVPAGTTRQWAADLVDRLVELQQADGSFKALDDRWLENDPVLLTAYSLLALGHAMPSIPETNVNNTPAK